MRDGNTVSQENNLQKNMLKALVDFIKSIFSQNKSSGLGLSIDNAQKKLSDNRFSQDVTKELVEQNVDCLRLIEEFIGDNKDALESMSNSNKINEISKLVEAELLPNLNAYLESKGLSEESLSNPLRRVEAYRHNIIDNVNAAFKSEVSGADEVIDAVANSFDKKMSEPNFSHNEKLKVSPRKELVIGISKETERVMNAKVSDLEL
tara:strand:+ start:44357 stop:44974 length:618 start_codon:yes stop_codon:yes gene_type:complete